MAKFRTIQSALNAGEISPRLRGRTDIPRYQHGLELCRNAIPMVWGGARRLPGTRFVAAAMGGNVRLIDFPVSIDGRLAGYVLELGNQKLRLYKNDAQIKTGGVPYEVTTPWPDTILEEIRYTASANTLYLFHPLYCPRRLYRKANDTDWVLENVPFIAWPMMRPAGSEEISLTPSATSGDITVTADADWFTAGMVGTRLQINGGTVTINTVTDARHIEGTVETDIIVNDAAQQTVRTIKDRVVVNYVPPAEPENFSLVIETLADFTETTLTTTPDVAPLQQQPSTLPEGVTVSKTSQTTIMTGTEPDKDWKEQAWSDLRGYPACGTFHEQRMVVGGSPPYPTYAWGSVSGKPLNFTIGPLDSDAWAFNLAAAATSLFHLIGTDTITALSGDKELTMRGGSDSPLTPSNVQVKSRTPHGSGLVRPVQIGGEIYFVPPSGLKLRGFGYEFSSDSYVAPDLAVIADHLVSDHGGIRSLAYAREPYSLLWVIAADGTLLTLTLDKEQEVTAWAGHGDSATRYISQAVTPGLDGIDQVWFAVQRLVGGQWTTCIEILDTALQTGSTVIATGSGLEQITGLGHLEGCLVDIKADGFYGGRVAVAGGAVALPFPADFVEVGLPYRTTIKDLPLEIVNPGQSIQGAATAVGKIRVRLHESQGCTINGEQVPFRRFTTANTPVEPFTGDKEVISLGRGTDPAQTQVTIEQDLPFDLTVLAIIKEVTVNG